MNSATILIWAFTAIAVVTLLRVGLEAWREGQKWMRLDKRIHEIGRQSRLGLHDRLGGDEIDRQARERRT